MATPTKGTQLYFVYEDSSGCQVVELECPTGITGGGGSKDQIEITCLNSEAREYINGFANYAAYTANIDFDPTKLSHQKLREVYLSDAKVWFAIGFSDGTSDPTADSACGLDFPTDRTFLTFEGTVSDFPMSFELNSVVKSAVSIQPSGDQLLFYKQ